MTKYLLLSGLVFSLCALAQSNDFEAELRMLEQKEEAAFTRAETVTNRELNEVEHTEEDMVTDSISTAASSVTTIQPQRSEITITPPAVKVRRIRSR